MSYTEEKIEIREMRYEDLDEVMYIEHASFDMPWTRKALEEELFSLIKYYYVAVLNGRVVGYAGMWHVVTEGHITNIAVDPKYRNRGVGNALVSRLLQTAEEKDMLGVTLEVRVGNETAKNLYQKNGFVVTGRRKEYYENNKEDAYIMWHYLIPVECIE